MGVLGNLVSVVPPASILMTVLYLLLGYTVWKLWTFLSWMYYFRKALDQFPSEKGHWFYGSFYEKGFKGFTKEWLVYELEKAKKFKSPYINYFGPTEVAVVLCTSGSVKPILKSSADGKAIGYEGLRAWLGDGLLLAKGKKWQRNRRLLTPAFHFDILKPYMKVYNQATEIFLVGVPDMSKLDDFASSDKPFPTFRHVSLLTLDIILQCAFSHKADCQTASDQHPYIQAVYYLSTDLPRRMFQSPLYIFWQIYKYTSGGRKFLQHCSIVHKTAEDIIHKRREELKNNGGILNGKRYLDFLDVLLTAKDSSGCGLSDEDIKAEADTFLFEGHDTTSSGLSWALYCFANYPECQKKAREEVDRLLDGKGNDQIEWGDLGQLEYLSLCLKETLRLYPPVPLIARRLAKDTEVAGKIVPAGVNASIPVWVLHRLPDVWGDDADEFKPERFLPGNISKLDSFAYIPFSAGPRNCIGQHFAVNEQKVALARILRRYEIERVPGYPDPEPNVQVVLRSSGDKDIMLRFKRR